MKQETIEEAAERFKTFCSWGCEKSFIEGANWQQERSYSDEDMEEYSDFCSDIVLREQIGYPFPTPKQWFEQFKKENNGKI